MKTYGCCIFLSLFLKLYVLPVLSMGTIRYHIICMILFGVERPTGDVILIEGAGMPCRIYPIKATSTRTEPMTLKFEVIHSADRATGPP